MQRFPSLAFGLLPYEVLDDAGIVSRATQNQLFVWLAVDNIDHYSKVAVVYTLGGRRLYNLRFIYV
jgi:hypothetical protein